MRRASVLVIESNPAVREEIRALLGRLEHRVISEAENGIQGLALARSLRPDLIFSSIVAPAVSGLDVCRALTEEQIAPAILYAVADDPANDLAGIEASGAMGFLTLPLRETELGAVIQIAIARWRRLVELDTEIRGLNNQIEARKLVGRAKAILMERHNLAEREAFRRIQSQSTTLGRPVHEIARAIITASEIPT